jgi:2-oxoglutarate dehydrogenase E2 component (dihydrolipoamide succinyltransferase)
VANIETDKVTVEIKSPSAGVITKFHVKAGDNLGVGKPLFDVDPDAPKPAGSPSAAKPAEKTEAPKAEEKPKSVEAAKDTAKEAPKADKPK